MSIECDCRKPGYVSTGECVCENVPPTRIVRYSFVVKGRYPSGTTAKMSGYVKGPNVTPVPMAVFEAAVRACQDVTPGLVVDWGKPGNVVVRKLKR